MCRGRRPRGGYAAGYRACAVAVACILAACAAACDVPRRTPTADTTAVRDDRGVAFPLRHPVRRIVSLAPSITETVFLVGAGAQLVGVTSLCDYPPKARTKTRVGDMVAPSVESIVGLDPDCVLLTVEGNTRGTYRRLAGLGVPCFVLDPHSVDGVLRSIRLVARLTGREREGGRAVDSLRALAEISPGAGRPPRVLFLLAVAPAIAAGPGTIVDELIRRAGATNAVEPSAARYPTLGREEILKENPDIVLISDDLRVEPPALLARFPEWRSMSAGRTGSFIVVDADLYLRPGPRIFQGLASLARFRARWQKNSGR